MDWLSGYSKRKKLTIDSTKIDSDLSHFPLPIPLGTSVGASDQDVTDIFDEVGSDYLKIAVTMVDGETQLYVEVEQWDATNEKALLWASRDTWDILSGSDIEIYLYFDANASDNTAYVGTPGNRTEVWESQVKFAALSGGKVDSTGNVSDGIENGGVVSKSAEGPHGGGATEYDGSDDYIDFATDSAVFNNVISGGTYTFAGWVKFITMDKIGAIFTVNGNDFCVVTGDSGCGLGLLHNSDWYRHYGTFTEADGWVYLVIDSNLNVYINNVLTANDGGIGSTNASGTYCFGYTDWSYIHQYVNAYLSACRFYNEIWSDAWRKADYHALTDNLLTWGETEKTAVTKSTYAAYLEMLKEIDYVDNTLKLALLDDTFTFDKDKYKVWTASAWQSEVFYSTNDIVIPTTVNGYVYRATSGGTSGSSEPDWPEETDSSSESSSQEEWGDTVSDGGVTWELWSYDTSYWEITQENG